MVYCRPSRMNSCLLKSMWCSCFVCCMFHSGRLSASAASSLNCMMLIALCICAISRRVFELCRVSSCSSFGPKRSHGSSA